MQKGGPNPEVRIQPKRHDCRSRWDVRCVETTGSTNDRGLGGRHETLQAFSQKRR